MPQRQKAPGFSLIELLLVLALIGILSGIAIPSYMGQRRRAQVIGDAQANARVMAMALETRKADNGIYGATSTSYSWTSGVPTNASFLPTLSLANATRMNFTVAITNGGLGYTLTVNDPAHGGAEVLTLTQTGAVTVAAAYK